MREPVRVFIIDPNPLARKALTEVLSKRPELHVLGAAANPSIATRHCASLDPQVLVIDLETPVEGGLAALKLLRPEAALPVVLYSSLNSSDLNKVEAHALLASRRMIVKPDSGLAQGILEDADVLSEAIIELSLKNNSRPYASSSSGHMHGASLNINAKKNLRASSPEQYIIAIGASTGGTQALLQLLQKIPPNAPGIVIVQHMPADFTGPFAHRLDQVCDLRVREARGGELVRPGDALIAHGGSHIEVVGSPGNLRVTLSDGPKVSGHRPSVDVLFHSVAKSAGPQAVGALLTGMGQDGAAGLLEMRRAGAKTLAQDEGSSAVFGMPRAAYLNNATQELVPIDQMAERIMSFFTRHEEEGDFHKSRRYET